MLHEKVTVLVPQDRLPEFYGRFGDFMLDRTPADDTRDAPSVLHRVGTAPTWTTEPGAAEVASAFWRDVTDPGRDLLRVLIAGAEGATVTAFSPSELVEATAAKTTQAVAGVFGGIGRVISEHSLPVYEYAPGKTWHFIWDWDPKKRRYSMSPGMAALLRAAGA